MQGVCNVLEVLKQDAERHGICCWSRTVIQQLASVGNQDCVCRWKSIWMFIKCRWKSIGGSKKRKLHKGAEYFIGSCSELNWICILWILEYGAKEFYTIGSNDIVQTQKWNARRRCPQTEGAIQRLSQEIEQVSFVGNGRIVENSEMLRFKSRNNVLANVWN